MYQINNLSHFQFNLIKFPMEYSNAVFPNSRLHKNKCERIHVTNAP